MDLDDLDEPDTEQWHEMLWELLLTPIQVVFAAIQALSFWGLPIYVYGLAMMGWPIDAVLVVSLSALFIVNLTMFIVFLVFYARALWRTFGKREKPLDERSLTRSLLITGTLTVTIALIAAVRIKAVLLPAL